MAKCSACGAELGGAVRFCSSCGRAVENSEEMATIDADPTIDMDATVDLPSPASSRRSSSSASRSSRSSSSKSSSSPAEFLIAEGRFLPGRLIAGRYRIIALLGKGGMGEVYRADDLALGQAVAIKFLPEQATRDEGMRERFRNEVRIARRVSHPNVCRVYDVGEVEGQTFFTMEYIDGEDLASLLRRIGRLPQDKALEIARQLCAGLAAAHTKGVLHRDLKPANIMLDGRGQVVITDFGLAGIADDIRGNEVRSGTPAYMAPEQLAGKEVTTRSDIYALGLVLYEVFTGKRAFAEKKAGVLRGRDDHTPSRPSSVVKDLDPVVEKVILRCLEVEPPARPVTALAVAGALPGGDPLAAALAAGETPSPQLVAASGETSGLGPRIALMMLSAIVVGLAITTYLSIRFSGLEKMHLDQPPEVLRSKAREIVMRLGYTEKPDDTAIGFDTDDDLQNYVEKKQKAPDWDNVIGGRPSLLKFWYRQGPDTLSASGYRDFLLVPDIVTQSDPPTTKSGMINVELDAKGRLIRFLAIPPEKFDAAAPAGQVDWTQLFAAAEIDPSKLQPAPSAWNSLAAADTRAAWAGVWPGTNWPLRIEAAAWRGKPVYFALLGDWSKATRMVTLSPDDTKNKISQIVGLVLLIALLGSAALLARRNYRHGRADREGALRTASVMFVLELATWLCISHLAPAMDMFGSLMLCIASGLLIGGITWLLYLALEPWIRRRWPHAMISWSRLISGQLRDPVVGRDVLVGVAFGVAWTLIFEFAWIPLARAGAAPQFGAVTYLLGARQALGQWLMQVPLSIFSALEFFFLLLGLKVILRKDWIAALAFLVLFVGLKTMGSTHLAIDLPTYLLVYGVLVLIVFRFGLVPLAIGAFTTDMITNVPFTADFSEWYMGPAVMALLSVIAIAAWGFYHSLGGEPVWKVEMQ